MKKMIAAALLAASSAAMAAGPYDGVYVNLANSSSYLSIHTNGANVVATVYGITPAVNVIYQTSIGNVIPTQLNTWELLQGSLQGSIGSLSGQVMHNACSIDTAIALTSTGAFVEITRATPTQVGLNSGVRCSAIQGSQIQFQRIF